MLAATCFNGRRTLATGTSVGCKGLARQTHDGRVDLERAFDYWKQISFIHTLHTGKQRKAQKNGKSLRTIFARFWELNNAICMAFKGFCLESRLCTVLAAFWSQNLYFAWHYLQYFEVFAVCCLDLLALGFLQIRFLLRFTLVCCCYMYIVLI